MKKINNSFVVSAISLAMALNLIASTSQASIVSLMSPALITESVLDGLAKVSVASGISAYLTGYYMKDNAKVSENFMKVFVMTLIVGFVLDESGNQKVVLKPVSEDIASQAGLSDQETRAYNDEIEIAQQIFDQVSGDVANSPETERVSTAKAGWEKYQSLLSPEAFSALTKLVTVSK